MVDFKKVKAPNNTITRNPASLASKADNIYEAVAVIGKRANQISVEMKEELSRKLQEFASYADNLEEIFEYSVTRVSQFANNTSYLIFENENSSISIHSMEDAILDVLDLKR